MTRADAIQYGLDSLDNDYERRLGEVYDKGYEAGKTGTLEVGGAGRPYMLAVRDIRDALWPVGSYDRATVDIDTIGGRITLISTVRNRLMERDALRRDLTVAQVQLKDARDALAKANEEIEALKKRARELEGGYSRGYDSGYKSAREKALKVIEVQL